MWFALSSLTCSCCVLSDLAPTHSPLNELPGTANCPHQLCGCSGVGRDCSLLSPEASCSSTLSLS